MSEESYFGIAPVGPRYVETTYRYTALDGQSAFTGMVYVPGFAMVFVNGVKLGDEDYAATDGTQVTITGMAIAAGDRVDVVTKIPSGLLDVYTQSQIDAMVLKLSGGTMTGALVLAADPVAALDAATKQFVEAQDDLIEAFFLSRLFGVNQTWQVLTGSRAFNITYTNTTDKAIIVHAWGGNTAAPGILELVVNGVTVVSGSQNNTTGLRTQIFGVVPPGATYSIVPTNVSLSLWSELR